MRPIAILVALACLVEIRAVAATSGGIDGLVVGAVFGSCLLAIALLGGPGDARMARRGPNLGPARGTAIGVAGGLALVGLTLIGRIAVPGPQVFPLGEVAPWAAVTVVVAIGEEAVLRGALFDAVERLDGPVGAILLTSFAFALMHVPIYGWHVVPLDLGVGLVFGGVRLATGGIAAPAAAHVVADLATRWL